MAEVVLFHHAQGLTPGVVAFADELRRAGHTVHTPDLLDGRTFASIEEGMAYAAEIGFPDEVIGRGARAVEGLPAGLVYARFARRAPGPVPGADAAGRAGSGAVLLVRAGVGVRLRVARCSAGQVHGMDADPVFVGEGDIDAARELVEQASDGELFLYPGDQHYFADSSLPSYDPEATALLVRRMLDFLR